MARLGSEDDRRFWRQGDFAIYAKEPSEGFLTSHRTASRWAQAWPWVAAVVLSAAYLGVLAMIAACPS